MEIQAAKRSEMTYLGPQKKTKPGSDLMSEFTEIYSSPLPYTGFKSREVVTYYK